MSDGRLALGQAGEQLAVEGLLEAGYTILARGWRCRAGELDIIARDGATLAFIEVRTRRGLAHGAAVESIGPAKAARLIRLANLYLAEQPALAGLNWRIDLIAIQFDRQGAAAIEHIVSAIEG